eukprot:1182492-Prorocentrum_minimum.AAC.3
MAPPPLWHNTPRRGAGTRRFGRTRPRPPPAGPGEGDPRPRRGATGGDVAAAGPRGGRRAGGAVFGGRSGGVLLPGSALVRVARAGDDRGGARVVGGGGPARPPGPPGERRQPGRSGRPPGGAEAGAERVAPAGRRVASGCRWLPGGGPRHDAADRHGRRSDRM